ncbi:MAG: sugar ABC transporter permease, partial [Clostridia bacterium]|nr:sugar ABC transporter permease [Clostridia bacterium]
MAKNDKSLLDENKDLTVEAMETPVEEVETLDEIQDLSLETAESDVQDAPVEKVKKPAPAFIVKIKDGVKSKFDDIKERVTDSIDSTKSWFKSLKKSNAEPEMRTVVTPDGEVVQEFIASPQLSNGERFKRFLRSQQGWLFVLPAVVLMAIFTFYPIISSFINAFREGYNPLNEFGDKWTGIGFENFAAVLRGDTGTGGFNFLQCLTNTMVLTFVSVPLSTAIALLIAVALNSIKPLQKAYQTVLFLPYLTNSLAMGAV